MAVVASRIRRRLQDHSHASPLHCDRAVPRYKGGCNRRAYPRRSASGLWMRAEEPMGTRSRPPGVVRGHWGLCRCATAGGCVPVHLVVPSHPSTSNRPPARPPARRRDWCCSGSSSSPSHRAHRMLQGAFPSQNLRRFAEVQGETGSVRAYTHTHTQTHTHTHIHTQTHMPLAHCE